MRGWEQIISSATTKNKGDNKEKVGGNMTKLEQLRGMIAKWKETKSISLADEICEFLVINLKEHGGEL